MTNTLDPSAPIQKPEPPKKENSTSLIDNDNLVLLSLADLKRFYSDLLDKMAERGKLDNNLALGFVFFVEALIENIEEDKERQLAEAQAAMEKFNPVTPVGDV